MRSWERRLLADVFPWVLLDDLTMGTRLVGGLAAYLRNPLTLPEARAILRQRLENARADFLALAKHAIFANRRAPIARCCDRRL